MRIGSLFSGIGGLELGLERSGLGETVWQVEQSQFCRNVLARHWPNAERYEDVKEVGKTNLAPVDVICGGFPCQDVSSAGNRAGLSGHRSGLWFEFARIVAELGPRWVIVENVSSGARLWVDSVRGQLERLGYETLPIPLSAQDVGAPHIRGRIFIIAHSDGEPIRIEPKRIAAKREAVQGQGQAKSLDNGENGIASHSQPTSTINAQTPRLPKLAGIAPTWPAPPDLCGVVNGVSGKLDRDRNRALGNAVVPQCAEVIGWIVRELANE